MGLSVGNYMLYSWVALPVFVLMILGLAENPFNAVKKNRLILGGVKYFSSISYAFFLAQFFTWPICREIFKRILCGNFMHIIISIAVCTGFSILLHEIVEKPIKRLFSQKFC